MLTFEYEIEVDHEQTHLTTDKDHDNKKTKEINNKKPKKCLQ